MRAKDAITLGCKVKQLFWTAQVFGEFFKKIPENFEERGPLLSGGDATRD